MNMNMIDLTPLFEALIVILAAVIAKHAIPWIKSRTTIAQQEYLLAAAKIAVYSAEKFYGAGKGDEKFAYALKVLREDYGIELDLNKIEAVIDATIKEMEQLELSETVWAAEEKPPVSDEMETEPDA